MIDPSFALESGKLRPRRIIIPSTSKHHTSHNVVLRSSSSTHHTHITAKQTDKHANSHTQQHPSKLYHNPTTYCTFYRWNSIIHSLSHVLWISLSHIIPHSVSSIHQSQNPSFVLSFQYSLLDNYSIESTWTIKKSRSSLLRVICLSPQCRITWPTCSIISMDLKIFRSSCGWWFVVFSATPDGMFNDIHVRRQVSEYYSATVRYVQAIGKKHSNQ